MPVSLCRQASHAIFGAVLAIAGLFAASGRAADLSSLDVSLRHVPIDASFYASMLRGGEQYDLIVKSKAFRQFADLPPIKEGIKKLREQWDSEEQYAEGRQFLAREEVQDLLKLVPEMLSDEVFLYSDQRLARALRLQRDLNMAQWRSMLEIVRKADIGGELDEDAIGRRMFEVVANNLDLLEMPTVVVGFKIRDKALANKQLSRLEAVLKAELDKQPNLKDRLTRTKVAGDEMLTLTLDGSMIPWAEIDPQVQKLQSKPGQLEAIKKKLTSQKIIVSLGVRSNYVILSAAPSLDHLNSFGGPGLGAKSLAAHPDMQRLSPHADKRLTSLSYVSAEYLASAGYTPEDFVALGKMIDEEAPWKNLPDNLELRVRSDVHEFFQDLAWLMPKPQAMSSCSFLTPTGMEGYNYSAGPPVGYDASQPLTLLEHAGEKPLFVSVSRKPKGFTLYPGFVKWAGIFWGYVVDVGLEQAPPEQQQKFKEAVTALKPLWTRFDETTKKKLIPGLADNQSGWVLGAFPLGESRPQALSLFPSPALTWGVSDAKLLVGAMTDYRAILEDFAAAGRKLAPPGVEVPPFKIPVPTVKEVAGAGTLYIFEIPLANDGDKLSLTAAVGPKAAIVNLSPGHAAELLAARPLAGKGALADPKLPSGSATRFEFAELIDALLPGVALATAFAPSDRETQQGLQVLRAVLDGAKAIRSISSRVYVEKDATVTHFVTEIKDLP